MVLAAAEVVFFRSPFERGDCSRELNMLNEFLVSNVEPGGLQKLRGYGIEIAWLNSEVMHV